MKNKRLTLSGLMALLGLLLAACGGTAVLPTATPEPLPTEPPPTAEAEETAVSGPQTFIVVPEESQATYIANEEFFADALEKYGIPAGLNEVNGTTPGVTGELTLNFDDPDLLEAAQITVDMSQLSTDQQLRDRWLRDNALETNRYPQATFTATAVSGLPAAYAEGEEVNFQLTGDLTVRDVTQSVTFDVTAVWSGDTIQGTATVPLQMTDFGIEPPDFANTLTVSNDFIIQVVLTARQAS